MDMGQCFTLFRKKTNASGKALKGRVILGGAGYLTRPQRFDLLWPLSKRLGWGCKLRPANVGRISSLVRRMICNIA